MARDGGRPPANETWQAYLTRFMRELELDDEMLALIMERNLITIQRWLNGAKTPRDEGALRLKLERRRPEIRNLRETLRVIRSWT